jgi:hypothetical protein
MSNAISEKLMTKILSIGAALTTVLVVSGSVTDPVTAPKLLVLGVSGFAAAGVLLSTGLLKVLQQCRLEVLFGALFTLVIAVVSFTSNSPFSQNLYGSYGRNNGALTYLFLVTIYLASLTIRNLKNFETLVKSLLFAGLANIIYCLWVIMFGDFVGWSNPYGNILGTLGNPNFIGSFLGIFFTAYLAFALRAKSSKTFRYSVILVLPITAFEIYDSHAIQGRVVVVIGVGILGYMLLRSRFSKMVSGSYLLAGFIVSVVALLGALQIGPFTKYIYKTSVSLRGQYWLAGWNTGQTHPFTGVGMDSFGDWYRRSRDIHALELPGVNVIVNAAHNVPMDMFAFGGWPLLLTYISIMGLAGFAALRLVARRKAFDPILAVLVTSWVGYQLQSIISINQIGLAVWGWLLSGGLIAYERATRNDAVEVANQTERRGRTLPEITVHPKAIITGSIGAIIGLLVAIPPLTSDTQWRSAQLSRSVEEIEATMEPSYFNPQNTSKYSTNIQILESSNFLELSHKYALEAVMWNPEAYDLWRALYFVKNSNEDEKTVALENMKRLDPLNPDVTSTQ